MGPRLKKFLQSTSTSSSTGASITSKRDKRSSSSSSADVSCITPPSAKQKNKGTPDDALEKGTAEYPPPPPMTFATKQGNHNKLSDVDINDNNTIDEYGNTKPSSPYHQMLDGADNDAKKKKKKANSETATVSSFDDEDEENNYKESFKGRLFEDHDDDGRSTTSTVYTDGTKNTVLTVDEIGDTTGFVVICIVMFLGDMARGILFPTMWPLVQELGGDERVQGVAVGAFSIGRIVSGPRFGSATLRFGYMRTLIVSTLITFVGMFMYAQTSKVRTCWYIVLSQIVTGYGSGTLGVTRAFVADVTPTRNRTTYMAYLTAMQYAGFTVTPLLGSALVKLFDNDGNEYNNKQLQYNFGPFILNKYSAPAYVMMAMCLFTLFLLTAVFVDRMPGPRNPNKSQSRSQKAIEEYACAHSKFFDRLPLLRNFQFTNYDAAIIACMTLNVALQGSIGSFETLGVAVAKTQYNLNMSTAGFIIGVCGTAGVIALLCMRYLARIASDVTVINGGITFMGIGIFILMVAGYKYDASIAEAAAMAARQNNYQGNNNMEPTYRSVIEYIVAMFFVYSTGFPVGHTAVIGLFSKLVGRRPQGPLLGWFASAGSIARVIFPIASGFIVVYSGYGLLFLLLFIVPISSVLLVFFNRKPFTVFSK